jgi:hypothetical protein
MLQKINRTFSKERRGGRPQCKDPFYTHNQSGIGTPELSVREVKYNCKASLKKHPEILYQNLTRSMKVNS